MILGWVYRMSSAVSQHDGLILVYQTIMLAVEWKGCGWDGKVPRTNITDSTDAHSMGTNDKQF